MSVMLPPDDALSLVREFFGARQGYFVDVGANQPEDESQTFHLEQQGWDGILIEPQPDLAAELSQHRKAKVYAVACSGPENAGRNLPLQLAGKFSSLNAELPVATARATGSVEVSVKTLDEVLADAQAPTPLDFVSIDVEGHENEVLRGFDLARWRPRLIVIEDHVLDRRLHNALVGRGYAWIRRTGLNSWYVPAASAQPLGPVGRLQFIRKYYLAVPPRRLRQVSRRIRRKLGLVREP